MTKKSKKEPMHWDDGLDEAIDSWAKMVDKRHQNTDWEKLAKNLQNSLMEEMKENEEHKKVIEMMNTIINYLEIRLGIYKGQ